MLKTAHTYASRLRHHQWLLLLGALCAVGPLSIDMYLPGAPAIAREYGVDGQSVQLTVVSYLLGLVVGQLAYGPISDHVGRKAPLRVGLLLYSLSSVLCGLAPNAPALIGLRFVQGLGGCSGMVIARAVIRDKNSTVGAARAFSLLMLVASAAPLLAPLLGAELLQLAGWRSMFGAMAAFGLLCALGVHFGMEETLRAHTRPPPRLVGVAAAYLALLSDRKFVVYTLCNGLVQGGMYAYIAGSAFVLIDLYGLSPQQYGHVFAVNSLGMILVAQINARLVGHFNLERIMGVTLVFLGVLGTVIIVAVDEPPIAVMLGGLFVFLACIGLIAPNAAAVALTGHSDNAGAASALMGTLIFAIGALCGVAMSGLHDGSARPLALVMAVCGIGAAVMHQAAVQFKRL